MVRSKLGLSIPRITAALATSLSCHRMAGVSETQLWQAAITRKNSTARTWSWGKEVVYASIWSLRNKVSGRQNLGVSR